MATQPLKIRRIDARTEDLRAAIGQLRERLSPRGDIVSEAGRRRTMEVFGEPLSPQQVVERICGEIRANGLSAVLEYTAKLDKAELTRETLRVPAAELAAAHAAAEPGFLATIRRVRENVLAFQRAILHRDVRLEKPHGGYLRQRYLPLARVGICVPGGAAAYPSTVLMTAVPAQAAGVEQIALGLPPTRFGAYNHDLLATCHELGIRKSIGWVECRRSPPWPMASTACSRWTRSSARAICSWRWPRGLFMARSTSTRSPARARWW